MNTEEPVKGYFALVLDEPSVAKLKPLAAHETVYCHHVTLAFRPPKELYLKYEALKGRLIDCRMLGTREDKKGQVGLIDGVVRDKKHLHVTISCRPDITPGYGNVMLREGRGKYTPLVMELSGMVEFILEERQ